MNLSHLFNPQYSGFLVVRERPSLVSSVFDAYLVHGGLDLRMASSPKSDIFTIINHTKMIHYLIYFNLVLIMTSYKYFAFLGIHYASNL